MDLGICHSPGGTVCCRFEDMSFTRWHCLLYIWLYFFHQVALFVVDLGTCHSPGGTVCCRFGDMSVQEAVNIDSYKRLYAYYEKFVEIIGEPGKSRFLCFYRHPVYCVKF